MIVSLSDHVLRPDCVIKLVHINAERVKVTTAERYATDTSRWNADGRKKLHMSAMHAAIRNYVTRPSIFIALSMQKQQLPDEDLRVGWESG
jgi:hypothetical protein